MADINRITIELSEKKVKQLDKLAENDMRNRSSYLTAILTKVVNKKLKKIKEKE